MSIRLIKNSKLEEALKLQKQIKVAKTRIESFKGLTDFSIMLHGERIHLELEYPDIFLDFQNALLDRESMKVLTLTNQLDNL